MINKKKIYGSLAIIGVTSMLSPLAAVAADGDNVDKPADVSVAAEEGTTSEEAKPTNEAKPSGENKPTDGNNPTDENKASEEATKTSEELDSNKEETPDGFNTNTPAFTLPSGKFNIKRSMLDEEEAKCIDQDLTSQRNSALSGGETTGENTTPTSPADPSSQAEDTETPTSTATPTTTPAGGNGGATQPSETASPTTTPTGETQPTVGPETAGTDTTAEGQSVPVDGYAGEENTSDKTTENSDPKPSESSTPKSSENNDQGEATPGKEEKEPSPKTTKPAAGIKVDLNRPSTVGLVLNGVKMQDIQLVESTNASKVTVEGLPEGLRYDEKSGSITGIPNIEMQPNEDKKVFNLNIEGAESPKVESITVFKDDNKNSIADKDENDGKITISFALENDTLYIGSVTGTMLGTLSIDEEGYLISKGARVKGDDGKEVRVIGEDGKLISPDITLPLSSIVDVNGNSVVPGETVTDEDVVVDLACIAALVDTTDTKKPDTNKPEPKFPSGGSDKVREVSDNKSDKKEEKTDDKGDGAKVLNNGANREPSGYQNNSEKYTPTLQNLDAGGRLVSGASGPKGPQVDTGGSVQVGLIVKIIDALRNL